MKKTAFEIVIFIAASAIFALGCDSPLKMAYDDFRKQAPAVCKDYCEEKVACELPSSFGPVYNEAFAALIRQCTVKCTAVAADGAYVWQSDPDGYYDRIYSDYIDADTLMEGFECVYKLGAYRCVDTGDSNVHKFTPPVTSICEMSNDCIAPFGVDVHYKWHINSGNAGGSCRKEGSMHIDVDFFR
jgi:hypothetical protein